MEIRKIGNSELSLSVITFGAWAAGGWMWGGTEKKEAVDAIRAAYAHGVTSIDTAPIYGQGDSESIVGEAIKDIQRDKIQILTKYGLRWDLNQGSFYFKSQNNQGQDIDIYKYAGRDSIIAECENSLKRLGTDYIDLYQIHWPDETTAIDESMEAVERLITQGKVRYAGVCNYNVEQMKQASSAMNIVSDQVPYSMVNRGIEEALIPYCREHGKSILAYSPMERGLLTGKIKPGHEFAPGDHRAENKYYSPESILKVNAFLDNLRPLATEKGISLSQLVLRWTVERPGITIALAGARNAEQAIANAKAAMVHLNQEEIDFINTELNTL